MTHESLRLASARQRVALAKLVWKGFAGRREDAVTRIKKLRAEADELEALVVESQSEDAEVLAEIADAEKELRHVEEDEA